MCPGRAASTRRSSRTSAPRSLTVVLLLGVSACHAAPRPTVAVASPPARSVLRLQQDIQTILAAPPLERSQWGIVVSSLKTSEPLYALNGGKLLMPGSTMKLVTLAAAAERLGWDYAFDTRVVATGHVVAGVLEGDVVLIGSGDPSIMDADGALMFASVADALRSRGVHSIAGRILGDDSVFDDEAYGPGWAWDDLAGRDGVAVSGLQYNENMVQAVVSAGSTVGTTATLTFSPVSGSPAVDNRVLTTSDDTAPTITARRSPEHGHLQLGGSIPIGSPPLTRSVAVDNPTLFFATALRYGLIAAGIRVGGPPVDLDDVTDPPPAENGTLLWTHRSPPLSTLAIRLMKSSQNLYAESLFKAIGGSTGVPTFEGGRTTAGGIVSPWGVAPTGLVQVDGSGLSRYNYVTADTLVAILTHVERDSRLREPFETSLPIAGQDGTLVTRMTGTAAAGNAQAKSGTLANVRSLAGYVTTRDGERLVFAIIANNYGTMPEIALEAIDAIVVKLAEFMR
jgi:serine-type D-Ala-D-Ala carboxypeptidase/endopeptidase (penicillin-binding protein 4)